jgi:hypothetical protein
MKKLILALGASLILAAGAQAQPAITGPTNGTVLYTGETNTITWNVRPGSWSFVWIRVIDNANPTNIWILGNNPPNNGSFKWTVDKFGTNTDFTIYVHDGGDDANVTPIHVIIPNGPRPPKTVPVPSAIEQAIAITWQADTTSTYLIESSKNGHVWSIAAQVQPTTTNGVAFFFRDQPTQFYRVSKIVP